MCFLKVDFVLRINAKVENNSSSQHFAKYKDQKGLLECANSYVYILNNADGLALQFINMSEPVCEKKHHPSTVIYI